MHNTIICFLDNVHNVVHWPRRLRFPVTPTIVQISNGVGYRALSTSFPHRPSRAASRHALLLYVPVGLYTAVSHHSPSPTASAKAVLRTFHPHGCPSSYQYRAEPHLPEGAGGPRPHAGGMAPAGDSPSSDVMSSELPAAPPPDGSTFPRNTSTMYSAQGLQIVLMCGCFKGELN
eukprot:1184000-Prorocentrum_minimum.AAC.5